MKVAEVLCYSISETQFTYYFSGWAPSNFPCGADAVDELGVCLPLLPLLGREDGVDFLELRLLLHLEDDEGLLGLSLDERPVDLFLRRSESLPDRLLEREDLEGRLLGTPAGASGTREAQEALDALAEGEGPPTGRPAEVELRDVHAPELHEPDDERREALLEHHAHLVVVLEHALRQLVQRLAVQVVRDRLEALDHVCVQGHRDAVADLLGRELLDLLLSEEAAERHDVVARVRHLGQDRGLLHQRRHHLAVVADPEDQARVPREVLAQVAHRVRHCPRRLQALLHVQEDGQERAHRALRDPFQQSQVVLGRLEERVLPGD